MTEKTAKNFGLHFAAPCIHYTTFRSYHDD